MSTSNSLGLDISSLKKGLREAKSELSNVRSEYKKLSSEADLCGNSHEKMEKKVDANRKLLDAQRKVCDEYRKVIDKTEEEISDLKKEQEELTQKLTAAKNATEKDEAAIAELEKQLDTCTKQLTNQEKYLQRQKNALNNAESAANGTEKSINDLNTELDNSATSTMSAQDALGTLSDVVGDVKEVVDNTTVAFVNFVKNGIQKAIEGAKELAKYSFNVGVTFESASSQLAATMGKTTEDADIQKLIETAKYYGSSTKYTATQAAEGLNILAQAGLTAEEQMAAIGTVLNLASAGALSLDTAASYVTASVKGFGDEMSNAAYYADLIALGASKANTNTNMLGLAFAQAAANAANYGQDAESLTLSLLRLAEQNVTGSDAATALNRAMMDLYTPTAASAKALDKIGVSAYDSTGKARDFNEVVSDISNALKGMSDEEANVTKNAIFTTYGLNAFNKMTVTSVDKVNEFKTALSSADGAADNMAKTMANNLQGAMDGLTSAAEGFGIAIYDKLAPNVKTAVDTLSGFIREQINNIAGSTGLGLAIDSIAKSIQNFASKLPQTLTKYTPALTSIFSLMGQIIAVIIDQLPVIIDSLLPSLASLLQSVLSNIPTLLSDILPLLINFVQLIVDNLPTALAVLGGLKIGGDLLSFGMKIGEIVLALKVLCTTMGTSLTAAASSAGGAIAAAAGPIGWAVAAITALVAIIVSAWKNSELFRAVVTSLVNTIKNTFMKVINNIIDKFKVLGERLGLGTQSAETFNKIIGVVATVLVEILGTAIILIIDILGGLIESVLSVIAVFIDLGKIIAALVTGDWKMLKQSFSDLGNDIVSAVTAPFKGIGEAWNDAMDGIDFTNDYYDNKPTTTVPEDENNPNYFVLGNDVDFTPSEKKKIVISDDFNFVPETDVSKMGLGTKHTENAKKPQNTLYQPVSLSKVPTNEVTTFIGDIEEEFENATPLSKIVAGWIMEEDIVNQILNMKSKIETNVDNMKTNLMGKVASFVTYVQDKRNTLISVVEAIKTVVENKIDEVNGFIDGIKTNIGDFVGEVVQKVEDFKGNLKTKIDGIKEYVSGVISNIKNTISSVRNINLYEIGKSIIQSLINGLSAKFQDLVNKVKDIGKLFNFNINVPGLSSTPTLSAADLGISGLGGSSSSSSGSSSMASLGSNLNSLNRTISTYSTNSSNSSTTNSNVDNRTIAPVVNISCDEPVTERAAYKNVNKVLNAALAN